MGQKVNPHLFRLATKPSYNQSSNNPWLSQWFPTSMNKNYSFFLFQDKKLRAFLKRIYGSLGYSVQKLNIQRTTTHIQIQFSLVKVSTSGKIKSFENRLVRNKSNLAFFAHLKQQKLVGVTSNISLGHKKEKLWKKTFGSQLGSFSKKKVLPMNKVTAFLKENYSNKKPLSLRKDTLQKRLKQSQEGFLELKALSEVRAVFDQFLKGEDVLATSFNEYFLPLVLTTSHTNFSLNFPQETKEFFSMNGKKVRTNRSLFYFTLLKTTSFATLFDQEKRSFPSQRLKRIKEGKFSESSKFLMKQNLFQQFQSFDSSAKLPGLKWPRTKSTYANSQLLQRNLVTAQGLSELISIQMTKQPYSRISIFKGSMYRGFFQLWQRLKIFLDEKKMPRPLGIRIECTGRWEGRDRKGRVVFKDGSIPATTLAAPLDYGFSVFTNRYGSSSVRLCLHWPMSTLTRDSKTHSFEQAILQRPLYFKKDKVFKKKAKKSYKKHS